MTKKIEISHKTIIFTVFFLALLALLYYIKDIILIFFLALLIMAILNPTVSKLSKKKIPRAVSVIVVYLLAVSIIGFSIASIVPPLVEQTTRLTNNLPTYLTSTGISAIVSEQLAGEIISQLGTLPAQAVKVGVSIFSNVIAVFTVLILAFYLLLSRDKMEEQIHVTMGEKDGKGVVKLVSTLEEKLGGWARGQLALMFLVGTTTFIGLTILGIPYSLPLALLAGLFEMIPNIGPIISAIPAVIIGYNISPVIGLATIALYLLIQQFENYVFVPKVMEKSAGVTPVITLMVIAVGFKIAGVVGIIISVPVFITSRVLILHYINSK